MPQVFFFSYFYKWEKKCQGCVFLSAKKYAPKFLYFLYFYKWESIPRLRLLGKRGLGGIWRRGASPYISLDVPPRWLPVSPHAKVRETFRRQRVAFRDEEYASLLPIVLSALTLPCYMPVPGTVRVIQFCLALMILISTCCRRVHAHRKPRRQTSYLVLEIQYCSTKCSCLYIGLSYK